ncbi:amidohydrolase [Frondihabitans sp. PAMC 28766]|uniref:amidohydrolase n=1 Tax=Frondihabitans sp. PAMC 28766 TaxID=1795630 RepID=UPI00078D837E|nr:amidohydrolase [Frondihabitans sp. PAMC 28766]AMM21924.1 amidohydrolase [Frondihabitans sp. PAMC 28766]
MHSTTTAHPAATRVDLHQHLLPPEFLDALRSRTALPMLRDEWTLLTEGESAFSVNPTAHDVERRREQERCEGKGEVMVSLPGNLRVEDLPFDDSCALIDIWHRSALALGDPFRVWAATPMTRFDLDGLSAILAHAHCVGLQLPASSMADAAAVAHLEPVLARVEAAGKPALVHPRHVVAAPNVGVATADTMPRAEQLKAAWTAWHEVGRAQHPTLRIAFIALAGLAPLAQAAAQSRGGKLPKFDPNVFYETSAYDERAIDAMARVVGLGPLVHGSDRPYRHPREHELGRAVNHALFSANPRVLLTGQPL